MRIYATLPGISKTFELRIDEDKTISTTVREIISAVCAYEGRDEPGDEFLAFSKERKTVLNSYHSAIQCGIRDGDTLIIV